MAEKIAEVVRGTVTNAEPLPGESDAEAADPLRDLLCAAADMDYGAALDEAGMGTPGPSRAATRAPDGIVAAARQRRDGQFRQAERCRAAIHQRVKKAVPRRVP